MSPSAERMAISTMTSQKSIQSKKSQLFFDDEDIPSSSVRSKGEKRSFLELETSIRDNSEILDVTSFSKSAIH